MDIIIDPAGDTQHQPRPAICPACGLTADNGIVRRSEVTATATYCCTNGHLFAVQWLEVDY